MGDKITLESDSTNVSYQQKAQVTDGEKSQQQESSNTNIWDKPDQKSKTYSTTKIDFSNFSNPANRAYTKLLIKENSSLKLSGDNAAVLLNSGRIVETMESIEEVGKKHLSFLSEPAQDNQIAGSLNGYYENNTGNVSSIFLGSVENYWQTKNKDIYTKFNATLGRNFIINNNSDEKQSNVVGNVTLRGRLDKDNFIYGAGVEFNAYSNNSKILDINISGKDKRTGIGADLTRRSTYTKDEETGETKVVSNMKLKLDILSNKNEDQVEETTSSNFSFETGSSALPSEVEDASNKAYQLVGNYIKPERNKGFDVDFEYTENKVGFTTEYNWNLGDKKKNQFLSIAPVGGLHVYTDQTLDNNNESLELTGGVTVQAGKVFSDGQTFRGSVAAVTDRLIHKGSRPYDSHYFLANLGYDNPKVKISASVDAGAIKSSNIKLKFINLNAEKQMKNSSIELSAGYANYTIGEEKSNIFNAMATYKYRFPYKKSKK